jgi:nucleoside-diphosphate-sugar epimerase
MPGQRIALFCAGAAARAWRGRLGRRGVRLTVVAEPGTAALPRSALDGFDAIVIGDATGAQWLEAAGSVRDGTPVLCAPGAAAGAAAASLAGARLTDCSPLRFAPAARQLGEAIAAGALGNITGFEARFGALPGAEARAAAYWDVRFGGGALARTGADLFDLLAWWLGALTACALDDDAAGGVEAEALARVATGSGVEGIVEVSRLRPLGNTIVVTGTQGRVEVALPSFALRTDLPDLFGAAGPDERRVDIERLRVDAWLASITGRAPPSTPMLARYDTTSLLRNLYACRRRRLHVWERELAPSTAGSAADAWAGRRVLVTGGTGFIGARVVELLAARGADVLLAVRDRARVARVARCAVRIEAAELEDSDAVARLAAGREIAMSLAYDVRRSGEQNLSLHRAVAAGCARAGVRRFVHLGSVATCDGWPGGDLDDASTCCGPGSEYKAAKCAMEADLARRAAESGLDAVVLAPTIVYGPYSALWTDTLVEWLATGTVELPRSGLGHCHAVYVDDVATALLAAAAAQGVGGRRYLVTGPAPIDWADFVGAVAAALGHRILRGEPPPVAVATRPSLLRAVWKDPLALANWPPARRTLAALRDRLGSDRIERLRHFVAGLRRDPGGVTHRPAHERPDLFLSRTRIDASAIRRDFALPPATSVDAGLALTQAYVRWRYADAAANAGTGAAAMPGRPR